MAFSEDRPTAIVLERYVVAVFIMRLMDPNGPQWTSQDFGYLSDLPVCDWSNGMSMNRGGVLGISCEETSSILRIVLNNIGLTGNIPWELSLLVLSNLQGLNIGANTLYGSIPTEFGDLLIMDWLRIDTNKLMGTIPKGNIPSEIDILTALSQLQLYNNSLTGSITRELSQLRSIERLRLDTNYLIGSLPSELGQLKALTLLSLNTNALDGTLPTELGQIFTLQNTFYF